jgi:signal transduction histidine kinase
MGLVLGTVMSAYPAMQSAVLWVPVTIVLALCAAALARRSFRDAIDRLEHDPNSRSEEDLAESALSRAWGKEHLSETVHELRTPLTTIVASLDMLREGLVTTPEESEAFVEQAFAATHHMMFLINDLLDWSAIEAGKLRVDLGICYANDLLQDARQIIQPMAVVRNIDLELAPLEQDLPIVGDANRILQVIFNLLGNALKFTPERRSVGLRASRRGEWVVFEVWDEGVGVLPEDAERIFEKYQRSGGKGSSGMQSNGIGLHVSKKLVQQMGGVISYRAREGGGSIFSIQMKLGLFDVHPEEKEETLA